MLVLTRRPGQALMIGEVEVYVAEVKGDQVRLSINAPRHIPIVRREVLDAVRRENEAAAAVDSAALDAFNALAPPSAAEGSDAADMTLSSQKDAADSPERA